MKTLNVKNMLFLSFSTWLTHWLHVDSSVISIFQPPTMSQSDLCFASIHISSRNAVISYHIYLSSRSELRRSIRSVIQNIHNKYYTLSSEYFPIKTWPTDQAPKCFLSHLFQFHKHIGYYTNFNFSCERCRWCLCVISWV